MAKQKNKSELLKDIQVERRLLEKTLAEGEAYAMILKGDGIIEDDLITV